MGKKKAILILKGSLKTHWIRYITNMTMNVNPADRFGLSTSLGLLRTLNTIDAKFLQPGFAYKFNVDKKKLYNDPSMLHIKFVNGYEKNYNLAYSPFSNIKEEILYYNDLVEFERAFNGQDDEPEDEA